MSFQAMEAGSKCIYVYPCDLNGSVLQPVCDFFGRKLGDPASHQLSIAGDVESAEVLMDVLSIEVGNHLLFPHFRR